MTMACPSCGQQLVLRVLWPTIEHRAVKQPQILSCACPSGCRFTDEQLWALVGLRPRRVAAAE
jgi:hypothetical protein